MGVLGPAGPAGFRRRGRRRGLIVGAAAGAAVAKRSKGNQAQDSGDAASTDIEQPSDDYGAQLKELQDLKSQNLITEDDYEAKKKQILGI
jgi:hypothetical protein